MNNIMRDTPTVEMTLIRHAEVDSAWKGICYGCLDVPLSQQGLVDSKELAERLSAKLTSDDSTKTSAIPTLIFHSGLSRTAWLADAIADKLFDRQDRKGISDERLKERNFGLWQGQSWDSAYNSDPEHFHDLVDQPDTYRPPEGESTTEMQTRILSWYNEVTTKFAGHRVIAVSHSGPIAAIAGHLLGLPANQWNPWIIGNLESIVVDRSKILRLNRDWQILNREVVHNPTEKTTQRSEG